MGIYLVERLPEPRNGVTEMVGARVGFVGVVAGVVAAGAGVVGVTQARQPTTRQDANGRVACNASGQGNVVSCNGSTDEDDERRILADALRFKDVPPKGPGPWQFVVTGDMGIGLKVRSTDTVAGEHLGGIAHHHVAWVVCKAHSGFDPDGKGDLWYRVKWDHQAPSTQFFESESGASATGWAYSQYLTPVGHNGEVPDC